MPNSDLANSLQKMVIHKGSMVQKIIYETVTFCTNKFPHTASLYQKTKRSWNNHNLPIIDGSQPILISLLLENGMDKEEIELLTKEILNLLKPILTREEIRKALMLRMSSKTKEKQQKECGSMVKSVSGGHFNLDFLILSDYTAIKEVYKAFPNNVLKHQETK